MPASEFLFDSFFEVCWKCNLHGSSFYPFAIRCTGEPVTRHAKPLTRLLNLVYDISNLLEASLAQRGVLRRRNSSPCVRLPLDYSRGSR